MKYIKTYESISEIVNVFRKEINVVGDIITKHLKEKGVGNPVTKNITSYDPIGDEHKYLTKTWKWTEKNQWTDDYHDE